MRTYAPIDDKSAPTTLRGFLGNYMSCSRYLRIATMQWAVIFPREWIVLIKNQGKFGLALVSHWRLRALCFFIQYQALTAKIAAASQDAPWRDLCLEWRPPRLPPTSIPRRQTRRHLEWCHATTTHFVKSEVRATAVSHIKRVQLASLACVEIESLISTLWVRWAFLIMNWCWANCEAGPW